MILYILFFVVLIGGPLLMWLAEPRVHMIQWGKHTAERPGIKNHPKLDDEPDVVEFVDYRYWIRLRPNPGVNLPVFGYWSKTHGRKRPKRPWE